MTGPDDSGSLPPGASPAGLSESSGEPLFSLDPEQSRRAQYRAFSAESGPRPRECPQRVDSFKIHFFREFAAVIERARSGRAPSAASQSGSLLCAVRALNRRFV